MAMILKAVSLSGGGKTSGAADILCLAATPVFSGMGLLSAAHDGPAMAGMMMSSASPLDGMALMYVLMAIFHSVPWLKRIPTRRTLAPTKE
jgi:hypothetical protein